MSQPQSPSENPSSAAAGPNPVPPKTTALINPVEASRRAFLRRSGTIAVAGGAAAMLLNNFTMSKARADDKNKGKDKDKDNNNGDDQFGDNNQRDNFESIQQHENDHVAFLVNALGAAARPKPTFQNLRQHNYSQFVDVSQALENTGVGAYLGAAPAINNPDYLAAAGSIGFIEARHAGFLNVLNNSPITANILDLTTDNSFEQPLTPDQVVAQAGAFIKSLNGGPPVTYSDTPSDANDIAILNFALALEYLEAEYYNINVPLFFDKHGH